MNNVQRKDQQVNGHNERSGFLSTQDRSLYLLWLVWVVWLPFLLPPVVGMFQAHPPLLRLVITLAGVVLFAGIYLRATWRNVQERFARLPPSQPIRVSKDLPLLLLVALSVVLAFLGDVNGAPLLDPFIFTSAYIAGRLSGMRAVLVLLGLALLEAAVGWLTGLSLFQTGLAVTYLLVVGGVTMSMVRFSMTSRELRLAREEIARLAVTNERLRIARDLHDLLGHNLSLIALKSELARRLLALAPERAAREISDIEEVARTTLQEVREAVASYRQPTLASELQAAQGILAAAGIAYHYEGDIQRIATLPSTVEVVLSWAVREGVTNVIRHSRAHQCTVRVRQGSSEVCVEVIDDGPGTPAGAVPPGNAAGGNGLRGLTERVTALGGHCEAGPHEKSGRGFRLAVSVPLGPRHHDAKTQQEPSSRALTAGEE